MKARFRLEVVVLAVEIFSIAKRFERAESPGKIERDSARWVGLMEMIHRIINSL